MSKHALRRLIPLLFLPWTLAAAAADSRTSASAMAAPAPEVNIDSLVARADTIALVSVSSVSSLVNRALSGAGLMSVEAYSYQLEVQRQWKGEVSAESVLQVSVQQCTRPLLRGERYLIFGEGVQRGDAAGNNRPDPLTQPVPAGAVPTWQIAGCDQVIAADQAEAYVVQLNQLYLSPVAQRWP